MLYGGLYTIFRFASYFQRTKNLCNRIVIYDNPNTDVAILKQKVVAEFPDLAQSLFVAVRDIEEIPDCDASIATFWTSCYLNAKFGRTSRKCYFVQDYEPMFYSAGVYHALAMETYKMGFKCIVNTPGLANLLKDKFGAECEFFYPCVDRKIYHITESEINTKLKRKQTRIVIYGRPLHKRNGFELALDVSERLKAQYGSAVQICSAGDEWSPADYGVTETITNLGRLTNLTDVAALYRDSDIGLVLMFTSHPSYQPLEFMACGCAVVTNHNESNTWLLRNRDNAAVSVPFPSALFDAISELIEDKTLRETIVRNGLATISDWNWDSQCEKIYEFIANS